MCRHNLRLMFSLAIFCVLPAALRADCPLSAQAPLSIPDSGSPFTTVKIGANLVAQTFVAPGTGCLQVQSVQVLARGVSPYGPLVVSVYQIDVTGAPTTQIGSSANIALFSSASLEFHTATFSTPVPVTGGQSYAIVFSQPDWTSGNYYYELKTVQNSGGGYAGGAVWNRAVTDILWGAQANRDIPMTITFTCCATGCVYSQGYWKTHYPAFWPSFATLTLGTVPYLPAQLNTILWLPVVGNGLISLDHQLIAAKLNILNGAPSAAIASTISGADTLIGALDVLNGGFLDPSLTGALNQTLDDYNNGVLAGGPAKCAGE